MSEIFPCQMWDTKKQACKEKYNCYVSPKFPEVSFNRNNFDKDCRGLSNVSLCLAFKGLELSARDLRFQAEKQKGKFPIITERIKI